LEKVLINRAPQGWEIQSIDEIVFFQEGPGVRNTQFTQSGVKLLNVGNINDSKIDLSKTKIYISEDEAYGKYKHFLVDSGDLLIACSGIVVSNFHNKIAFVKDSDLPLCMNTSTMRFKTLDPKKLSLDFFRYFLMTDVFKHQLQKLITGSAQLNFGPSHIKQMSIILPPLPQQQKIVSVLNTASALVEKQKSILEKYDLFLKSKFIEMFGDPVKNPMGLEVVKLKDLTSKIGSGATPKGGKEAYHDEGISLIRSLNVHDNQFLYKDLAFIDDKQADGLSNVVVEQNDVLLNITGASVCRTTIVPDNVLPARVNQHVAIIRPKSGILNSGYLLHLFLSNYKQHLNHLATSGGATREALTKADIEELDILLPPLELQSQFVQVVEQVEILKQKEQQKLEKLQTLYNALMDRAFKGEIR